MESNNQTDFQQRRLGYYAKTGKNKPKTSIQNNCIQYRTLVINNILDTLSSAFPLTSQLLGEKSWKRLVYNFFSSYRSKEPQLWKLPKEFITYFEVNQLEIIKNIPHIKELLLLEWIEIEVFMMPDREIPLFEKEGYTMQSRLIINPEISFYTFEYPVFKKEPAAIQPEDKGYYFLSLHRHDENKDVLFTELGPMHIQILIRLQEEALSGDEITSIFLITPNELKQFIVDSIQKRLILGYINSH